MTYNVFGGTLNLAQSNPCNERTCTESMSGTQPIFHQSTDTFTL